MTSILLRLMRGTYGRYDDPYNAINLANGLVALGKKTTIYLEAEGVYLALKNQSPNDIGLASLLDGLSDFIELGGEFLAEEESLKERGLSPENLMDYTKPISKAKFLELVNQHEHCIQF